MLVESQFFQCAKSFTNTGSGDDISGLTRESWNKHNKEDRPFFLSLDKAPVPTSPTRFIQANPLPATQKKQIREVAIIVVFLGLFLFPASDSRALILTFNF